MTMLLSAIQIEAWQGSLVFITGALGYLLLIASYFTLDRRYELKSEAQLKAIALNLLKDIVSKDILEKLGRIEVKVDTMWSFQLRRGFSEVERMGFGESHSALVLYSEGEKLMLPYLGELKAWYADIKGNKLSLIDLAIAIEGEFGERITNEVCKKVGLHESGCLLIAMSMLRKIDQAELNVVDCNAPPEK